MIETVVHELGWCDTTEAPGGGIVRLCRINGRRIETVADVAEALAKFSNENGSLFRSTEELCKYYQKIFNRKEVNTRWLGRRLSSHIKSGRIKCMSRDKDEGQAKRGLLIDPNYFQSYIENFVRSIEHSKITVSKTSGTTSDNT
jgi:hypothetical protein